MNTSAIRARGNILIHPRAITVATVLIIILWFLMQWRLSAFLFLAVVILFIIGLKKPLWAVAAILISQMTIPSYMIATLAVDISLRLILMLLLLFIMSGTLLRKEADLGPHARKIIIPMIILLVLTTVSNIINSLEFDIVFKHFRNMFVGLLFIILLPAIIENLKQLKLLLGIIFIVAIASAIIGVLQHFNILGFSEATITPGFFGDSGRVPGMSEEELQLAYILPVVLMIILSIFFTKGIGSQYRNLLFLPMIPMLMAIYFTYTRSAIFAVGCGILSIILFMRIRIRWEIILVLIAVLISLIVATDTLEGTSLGGRTESGQEGSAMARDILRQAGIAIALDNPIFGIGNERFLEVSPRYASRVDPYLIEWEGNRYYSYTTLGNDEPHNDFIMIWLSSGTLSMIVYIVLHFLIIYTLMYSFRNTHNRFIKGLSVGLAAALVSYVVNSFYHNLLASLPLLWILAGLSLVTAKLSAQEQKKLNISSR